MATNMEVTESALYTAWELLDRVRAWEGRDRSPVADGPEHPGYFLAPLPDVEIVGVLRWLVRFELPTLSDPGFSAESVAVELVTRELLARLERFNPAALF